MLSFFIGEPIQRREYRPQIPSINQISERHPKLHRSPPRFKYEADKATVADQRPIPTADNDPKRYSARRALTAPAPANGKYGEGSPDPGVNLNKPIRRDDQGGRRFVQRQPGSRSLLKVHLPDLHQFNSTLPIIVRTTTSTRLRGPMANLWRIWRWFKQVGRNAANPTGLYTACSVMGRSSRSIVWRWMASLRLLSCKHYAKDGKKLLICSLPLSLRG